MAIDETERSAVDVIVEEFAEKCRRGLNPSIDEYIQKHPEKAQELRDLLQTVAIIEQLKVPEKSSTLPGRIGEYNILREIGRGGMGIVYEAEHKALGRRVALKVAPMHALLDPVRRERFQREAQAAARLHHTNIVPVFGIGESDGMHYFVMQYIPGWGLNELLAYWKKQPASARLRSHRGTSWLQVPEVGKERYWRWVAQIGIQVAHALAYAHQQGTLHRDIKPANIILDARANAWVADFGLAKIANHEDLTQTGDIIGTIQYLAPEALQGHYDARSDVYGLAMTLYELLTLQAPFQNMNTLELLKHMGEHDPVRPRLLNSAIPGDLETIVLKGSARNLADRYQSSEEFAADLRRFVEDRPIAARKIGNLERFIRWRRRNRLISTLSAVAVASLLFALIAGWVGYVKTNDALEKESKRREEADAAKKRSEMNERMSLQAFEEIFNQIGTVTPMPVPMPMPAPNGPHGGPAKPPRESLENAEMLQTILKFYDRFAAANETNGNLQFEAAKAHARVGELRMRMGEWEASENAYRRALAMAEKLSADKKEHTDYTAFAAHAHFGLGSALHRRHRDQEEEKQYREALALQSKVMRNHPQNPEHLLFFSIIRRGLGELLCDNQNVDEGRPLLENAAVELQRNYDKTANPRIIPALADLYRLLSRVLAENGERSAADKMMKKANEFGPVKPQLPQPRNNFRPDFEWDQPEGPERRPPLPPPQDRL